ncbi:hypothetical protein ACOMHN_012575 [Nucella lapillus]
MAAAMFAEVHLAAQSKETGIAPDTPSPSPSLHSPSPPYPTIVSKQTTGNDPDNVCRNNNQTSDEPAAGEEPPAAKHDPPADDIKAPPMDTTPSSVIKDLDLEESRTSDSRSRPTDPGGKAWRQMQRDAELLRWHNLRLVKRVGGGSVSTVYLAKETDHKDDKGTPTKVVVRAMDWTSVLGDYQRSVYPRLLKMYESMPPHPNIVGVFKRIVDGRTNYLIQEWCSQGSLRGALSPEGCFARGMAEGTARDLLRQVCQGLQFLHGRHVPHGRLTSDNIVLDKDFKAKLTDFGYPSSSCSNCTDDDRHLRYRAPEMLRGKPFTAYAADVWSVGVVMYEMLHVSLPYSARDIAQLDRCFSMPPIQCRTSLSYPGVVLLKRLLTLNARFRPSLDSVCCDPWMIERPKGNRSLHSQCYRDHDSTGLTLLDQQQQQQQSVKGEEEEEEGGGGNSPTQHATTRNDSPLPPPHSFTHPPVVPPTLGSSATPPASSDHHARHTDHLPQHSDRAGGGGGGGRGGGGKEDGKRERRTSAGVLHGERVTPKTGGVCISCCTSQGAGGGRATSSSERGGSYGRSRQSANHSAPVTEAWKTSYIKQLCDICLHREIEEDSAHKLVYRYTDNRGRRMAHRVAAMFTHYSTEHRPNIAPMHRP